MSQPEKQQETEHTEKPIPTLKPSDVGGHTEELVDHYWGSINYIFGLIRASEIKAGLILSFYGIILNLIYTNIGEVLKQAVNHSVLYVLLALWFTATVISIFFSIRCFMPRIESKFNKNVFFFKDVITHYGNVKEFSKTFYRISLDQEELFDQLGQQIFINSKIAALKFKNVNRSLLLLAIGLLLLFIVSIYYMVVVLNTET